MKTKKRGPPLNRPPSAIQTQPTRPSIALSQNYLREGHLIEKLIQRSTISQEDTVLDIGAGTGVITNQLVKYAGHVVAVEKDPNLTADLASRFSNKNVELIESDFLQLDLPAFPYKVFANIPYNITTAIITRLTCTATPPLDAYLVVQKEAAHKFMGIPRESMYALLLKPWFRLSIVHHFNRDDFIPTPNVDSVLLKIQQRPTPLLAHTAKTQYQDFVTYCFTNAHSSLYNTLRQLIGRQAFDAAASTLRVDPSITPTRLDFELWLCLFCQFAQHAPPDAQRRIFGSEQQLKHQQSQLQKLHRTR